MSKKKSLIILISSMIFAFLCFALSYLYIQTQLELVDVIISTHHLNARDLISDADVEVIQMPQHYVSEYIETDLEDVIGTYVVIDGFIPSHTMIHNSAIESLDESIDRPSLLLKENQSIFALDATLISTAGNSYVTHQKVDVYGAIKLRDQTVVDRLISAVRIVGLKDKNGDDVDERNENLPKVILLAVEQSLLPILTKLEVIGEISLSASSYLVEEQESMAHRDSSLWSLLSAS